uniref:Glucose-6-phosphate isomerase n=1 Tax=Desertifilum tharense IPPAS B-1220 TaxID=1781255 RepID=A0ACD5GVJ9_9CYAN
MDAATLWQRYQDWLYYHEGLEFYVDISRMRFDEAFVEAMKPRFAKAFEDMAALEKGAIANPDEDRMVGHYWLRHSQLAPTAEIQQEIEDTLVQIETFARKIHSGDIHPPDAVQVYGYSLNWDWRIGTQLQFVAEALAPSSPPMEIHFIDNSDPAGIDAILLQLEDKLASTLVIAISKSGGTPETRNGTIEVQKAFESQSRNFAAHAIAITSKGSKLDQQAKAEGWLTTFPMFDWIGGRTSELSAVGLVDAALQGIDIRAMLAGTKEMDEATRIPDIKTNPAALLALSWYSAGNGKGEKDMVVLPYKDSLLLFSRYLQQLVMESLGKEKDLDGNIVHQGIAVYGNKGSTDQHAYVQQLREGVPNFFATLIEVLEDRQGNSPEIDPGVTSGDYLSGFLQGTRKALYENHRDSITVTIPQVNPRTVGALIALYERAVGLYGFLVNVNAYHQPGVEAGKKAAADILALQNQVMAVLKSQKQASSLVELAAAIGQPQEVEAIYKIIRHLAANHRGIHIEGSLGKPSSLKVALG